MKLLSSALSWRIALIAAVPIDIAFAEIIQSCEWRLC